MNFSKAFALMKRGEKVKLPSWAGYWYWSKEKQTIIMHTKDGVDMDIRETQIPDYTFGNIATDEWVLADGKNCPELGGEALFSFSEAIKYLKRGMKVARKGWNGKKQYIQLATGISYKTGQGEIVNCEHEAVGNMAIAFCGTSGVQMGWLASQADMLKVYMRLYEALRYALRRGIVNKRQSFCFALEVWHINYSVPHRAGI